MTKEDSSANEPLGLSVAAKVSIFHLSMSGVSHGFSFLCVEGIATAVDDVVGLQGKSCFF